MSLLPPRKKLPPLRIPLDYETCWDRIVDAAVNRAEYEICLTHISQKLAKYGMGISLSGIPARGEDDSFFGMLVRERTRLSHATRGKSDIPINRQYGKFLRPSDIHRVNNCPPSHEVEEGFYNTELGERWSDEQHSDPVRDTRQYKSTYDNPFTSVAEHADKLRSKPGDPIYDDLLGSEAFADLAEERKAHHAEFKMQRLGRALRPNPDTDEQD